MDVLTRLAYLRPSALFRKEKMYYAQPGSLVTLPVANYNQDLGPEQLIRDVRGREQEFSLWEQGFVYRSWSPADVDWSDEQDIAASYEPQVKQLLARELGLGDSLKRCDVFDWRLRKGDSKHLFEDSATGKMTKIRPATMVHIDHTPRDVLDRLDRVLSKDEQDDLLGRYRLQVFNVWRPIGKKVQNWPLTICDARTVTQGDLEELELVTTEDVSRSYLTRWSDAFRFYYLSQMTDTEVCIFKIFDSAAWDACAATETTLGCPHTAFNPADAPLSPPRESIEVRLFVFSAT